MTLTEADLAVLARDVRDYLRQGGVLPVHAEHILEPSALAAWLRGRGHVIEPPPPGVLNDPEARPAPGARQDGYCG